MKSGISTRLHIYICTDILYSLVEDMGTTEVRLAGRLYDHINPPVPEQKKHSATDTAEIIRL